MDLCFRYALSSKIIKGSQQLQYLFTQPQAIAEERMKIGLFSNPTQQKLKSLTALESVQMFEEVKSGFSKLGNEIKRTFGKEVEETEPILRQVEQDLNPRIEQCLKELNSLEQSIAAQQDYYKKHLQLLRKQAEVAQQFSASAA